jgi:predicted porin
MQKKLMALAVAGALSAPVAAFAQASNVQIYGRANVGLDNYQANGGTTDVKSRMRVFDQTSRFGVRGSEDLGGGLKAIFQIESGVNIDTGSANGQSGAANASTGTFASRDSYAGLEGGFGRVQFGRLALWYTNGVIEQITSNYVNIGVPENAGALSKIGQPLTRQSNVVLYTTPTFGGFNAGLYYSPTSENAVAGASTDGKITGVVANYSGVVNVKADWAKSKIRTSTATATLGQDVAPSDITGIKVGVGYPYAPGAQISLIFIGLERTNQFATLDKLKQRGFVVTWEQVFGNIQPLAQYGRSNKATGCSDGAIAAANCDDSESTSIMVGVRYLMSKRTATYVTYNKTTNKANAALDYTSAGYNALATIPNGADPRIWAVGILHNF